MFTIVNASDGAVVTFLTKYWPLITPLAVVVAGAVATGIFSIWNRRGEAKTKAKAPLPPTWPEMWARIDKLEERITALEAENDALKDDLAAQKREKAEIFHHVVKLERLVPEPPPRPQWELHILPPLEE